MFKGSFSIHEKNLGFVEILTFFSFWCNPGWCIQCQPSFMFDKGFELAFCITDLSSGLIIPAASSSSRFFLSSASDEKLKTKIVVTYGYQNKNGVKKKMEIYTWKTKIVLQKQNCNVWLLWMNWHLCENVTRAQVTLCFCGCSGFWNSHSANVASSAKYRKWDITYWLHSNVGSVVQWKMSPRPHLLSGKKRYSKQVVFLESLTSLMTKSGFSGESQRSNDKKWFYEERKMVLYSAKNAPA